MTYKKHQKFEGTEPEYTVRTRDLDAWLDYLVQNGTFKNRDEAIDDIVNEYKSHFITRRASAPRILLNIVSNGYRNHINEDEVVRRVMDNLYPIPLPWFRKRASEAVNVTIDKLGICATARMHGWDKEQKLWGLDSPDAPKEKPPLRDTIRNHIDVARNTVRNHLDVARNTVRNSLGSARNATRGFLRGANNAVKTFHRVASSHISSLPDRLHGETEPVDVSAHIRHYADGKTSQVKAHVRGRPKKK